MMHRRLNISRRSLLLGTGAAFIVRRALAQSIGTFVQGPGSAASTTDALFQLLGTMPPNSWAQAPNTSILANYAYATVTSAPDYNATVASSNGGFGGISGVTNSWTG